MNINDINPGLILRSWHDEGANIGSVPIFYIVLKVAKVKIFVKSEYGQLGWMYPAAFDKIMHPNLFDDIFLDALASDKENEGTC